MAIGRIERCLGDDGVILRVMRIIEFLLNVQKLSFRENIFKAKWCHLCFFIIFYICFSFQIGLNATGGQKSNNPFL